MNNGMIRGSDVRVEFASEENGYIELPPDAASNPWAILGERQKHTPVFHPQTCVLLCVIYLPYSCWSDTERLALISELSACELALLALISLSCVVDVYICSRYMLVFYSCMWRGK